MSQELTSSGRTCGQFESFVEELTMYVETHGHMNVTRKDNESLYSWISSIKSSYRKVQKGRTPSIKLTLDRLEMLQQIGFDFKCKYQSVVSFESRVEALKLYKEKHGHMRVSEKEDMSLNRFLSRVRRGLKHKKLTPERMQMLQEIEFEFECRPSNCISFASHIEALKLYKAKHGHMNVSLKEDKSLNYFISNVRKSMKRIEEGQTPNIKLTQDRIKMLQEIGFSFKSRTRITMNLPFESIIEALKLHKEKHGHMNVSIKEDKSLYSFIENVRRNVKKIQEGRSPYGKLTSEQMEKLREIDFPFETRTEVYLPFESQVEALRLYQAKHGHIRVSAKEDESLCNFIASVRQSVTRMENGQASTLSLTPDQMTALENVGLICRPKGDHTSISGIPSTNSSRFKRQRVEESLHEKMPVARSFPSSNENKDMEEIEGDVIPRWLMNDEEEIDSSDSMLAEISIKIEGGTY